jgi:predicted ArsR family transcriptional regulator
MIELSDKQVAGYFHQCFTAVDGLWFMKVEEQDGFVKALEIDKEVWKVLPKIQARFFKAYGKYQKGIDALFECLSTKLVLEGFQIQSESFENGFNILVNDCPWNNLLIKSGRENISARVGFLICNTEYTIWASEFDDDVRFQLKHQICGGSEYCTLHFSLCGQK